MAKAKDESQDHGIHDQSHGKAKTKTPRLRPDNLHSKANFHKFIQITDM